MLSRKAQIVPHDNKLWLSALAFEWGRGALALAFWGPDIEEQWPDRTGAEAAVAPRLDEAAGNDRKDKNIFGADVFTAALTRDLKLRKGRGRRRDHPWDKIRREIVYQILNNGSPKWPQNYSALAEDIAGRYPDRSGKGPDISDLRKMIAAIVKVLRALLD